MSTIRSYTSVNKSAGWFGDMTRLIRGTARNKRGMAAHVKASIDAVNGALDLIEHKTGVRLEHAKMLEIGVGQLGRQMAVFGVKNDVVGIDLDVIPRGFDPAGYASMLKTNGPTRVAKTLMRKAMGFDRAFMKEAARQLGVAEIPVPRVEQMDATRLDYPDASFDFVYSFVVFEHLPEPGKVLREATRVLKPGGVCYTCLHPYTAEDGFHDLRIIDIPITSPDRGDVPLWAHLRPGQIDKVRCAAYINKLRVAEWRRIFEESHPGTHVELTRRPDDEALRARLAELRASGELKDYTDEELLGGRLVAVWRKPPQQ